MKKEHRGNPYDTARQTKTMRDAEIAAAGFTNLAEQAGRESAAELRLLSLISEMEKFDDLEEDNAPEPSVDEDFSGPHWHWSDDPPDSE